MKNSSIYSLVIVVTIAMMMINTINSQSTCYSGYTMTSLSTTSYGYSGQLIQTGQAGPYGDDINQLQFVVYFQNQQTVRFKIFDPNNERWEVPFVNQMQPATSVPSSLDYDVKFTESPFGFSVTRIQSGEVLFNSTPTAECSNGINGLIYSNYYIELSTVFPDDNPYLYGLGERSAPLRLDNSRTYTLFAKDQGTASTEYINLYGSHPFYLHIKPSNNVHGVFMLNSNAMDVVLESNSLTYKIIGGIIDMFVFLGPEPKDVIQQYFQVIGNPHMPSYWSLGWHQCRWGYNTIEETAEVVGNYSSHGIPLETMWNDIDYMNAFQDFTTDPDRFPQEKVAQFIDQLHANDQHYIMIVDPGINTQTGYAPYDDLLASGAYVKTPEGQPVVGRVWPGETLFPDFFHPNGTSYWGTQFASFYNMVPFDGIWLDMNEPSNFCNGDCGWFDGQQPRGSTLGSFDPNNPPYIPGGQSLDQHTINLTTIQYSNISFYNSHSLFGYMESMATVGIAQELLNTRSTLISRSTYPGSGKNNGHWLGDNDSTFNDLYLSIPGILNMNMFGIPLVGADICGFNGNTTAELCARWMQLGNFYPFSRNHNAIYMMSQEPYTFGPQVTAIATQAIKLKYTLLPYYYTLFYRAHTIGDTVVRPLFFEFITDASTYEIDQQFLVGGHLMVSPVLVEGATSVNAYFPQDNWYDFYSGAAVEPGTHNLSAPLEVINLHIRGGIVLPTQPTFTYVPPAGSVPITTRVARTLPYTLYVTFTNSQSKGELYIDDGISLDSESSLVQFTGQCSDSTSSKCQLSSSIEYSSYPSSTPINVINVYGVTDSISSVTVNGQSYQDFDYLPQSQVLTITNLNLEILEEFSISWN